MYTRRILDEDTSIFYFSKHSSFFLKLTRLSNIAFIISRSFIHNLFQTCFLQLLSFFNFLKMYKQRRFIPS